MQYYIYKNKDGAIIGYNQTKECLQSPAIEVSKEEFINLGFYIEPPAEGTTIQDLIKENNKISLELEIANANLEMLGDCLAEMAVLVYP